MTSFGNADFADASDEWSFAVFFQTGNTFKQPNVLLFKEQQTVRQSAANEPEQKYIIFTLHIAN